MNILKSGATGKDFENWAEEDEIEQRVIEAYKKGYIDGVLHEMERIKKIEPYILKSMEMELSRKFQSIKH